MPALPVLLGLIFIVLKLTEVIAWSWVWVLSPFWIMGLIALVMFILFMFGFWRFSKKIDMEQEKINKHMKITGFDKRL